MDAGTATLLHFVPGDDSVGRDTAVAVPARGGDTESPGGHPGPSGRWGRAGPGEGSTWSWDVGCGMCPGWDVPLLAMECRAGARLWLPRNPFPVLWCPCAPGVSFPGLGGVFPVWGWGCSPGAVPAAPAQPRWDLICWGEKGGIPATAVLELTGILELTGPWVTRVLLAGLGLPPAPIPRESDGTGLLFWKF